MSLQVNNLSAKGEDFEKFFRKHSATIAKTHRVALAELTVFCGENVMQNTRAACEKGLELLSSGFFGHALLVNSASNHRWAMSVARKLAAEPRMKQAPWDNISIMTLGQGRLSRELTAIRTEIERKGIDVILINSWEFACANARYREEAIFELRRLSSDLDVTIIVYSQAVPKEYKAGCIMRGTLGRLSALAQIVGPVETHEEEATPEHKEHSEHFVSEEGHLNGQAPLPEVTEPVAAELLE